MEILNSKDTLKLTLDSKDILIPSKYNSGIPDSGYDIALIGLSRKNKLIIDKFIIHKDILCYDISKNCDLDIFDDFEQSKN